MTTQPPRIDDEPPLPIGDRDWPAAAGAATAPPSERETAHRSRAATRRAGRAPDYRLRGLDLDAPSFTETPPRPVENPHPSRRRRRRRLLAQCLVVLAVVMAVAGFLRGFVVQPYSVSSASMVPTLAAGTDVLVVRWTALTGPISAGDIVVLHEPRGAACASRGAGGHDVVERVIGLPGQTIWSVTGTIYVNGQRLDEPGWYNPPFGEVGTTDIPRTTIPQGSYFVMGDNRTDSCDSRSFGPIRRSLVVGKVVGTIARNGHLSLHSL